MDINYAYIKTRAQFGGHCNFANEGPEAVDNVFPNRVLQESYILKNPADKSSQEVPVLSGHEVNTLRPDYIDRGMNHDQGGWPKDLNTLDEEAVLRFRNKLAREDNFIQSMKQLCKPIEHAILQNNAINIYEKYFEDTFNEYSVCENLSQIRNVYRDQGEIPRPVNHLSWCPDGRTAFAASYCDRKFRSTQPKESCEAYIWNVEIPNPPETVFNSNIPIVSLEWNPKDWNLLIGGMYTGQIAFYDIRKAPGHVAITSDEVSHRDPVHSVLWILSKTGVDFFSTSSDGAVKWWDCRYLTRVTESIILDPTRNQNLSQAYPASCLEYDLNVSSKYLVGTDNGNVICGNRKGMTLSEKVPLVIKTHDGPIYALSRNAAMSKYFLSVGDWTARIWTEECKESAIIWTKPYKVSLTGGEWSKSRYSVFFLTRSDGYLDLWDLLQERGRPFISQRVSEESLTAIRAQEQGQIVVVGDESGKCHLVQYAEGLSNCLKKDRALLTSMFERETRREKILESKIKEMKYTMKLKAQLERSSSKFEEFGDPQKEENRLAKILKAQQMEGSIVKIEELDDKQKEETRLAKKLKALQMEGSIVKIEELDDKQKEETRLAKKLKALQMEGSIVKIEELDDKQKETRLAKILKAQQMEGSIVKIEEPDDMQKEETRLAKKLKVQQVGSSSIKIEEPDDMQKEETKLVKKLKALQVESSSMKVEELDDTQKEEIRLAKKRKAYQAESCILKVEELYDTRKEDVQKAEEFYWEQVHESLRKSMMAVEKRNEEEEEEEEEYEEVEYEGERKKSLWKNNTEKMRKKIK